MFCLAVWNCVCVVSFDGDNAHTNLTLWLRKAQVNNCKCHKRIPVVLATHSWNRIIGFYALRWTHFSLPCSLFLFPVSVPATKKPIKHSASHCRRTVKYCALFGVCVCGCECVRETTRHKKENGKLRRRRRRRRWQRRENIHSYSVARGCINENKARKIWAPWECVCILALGVSGKQNNCFSLTSLLLLFAVCRCCYVRFFTLPLPFAATHTRQIFVYSTSCNPPHRIV